jgi:hypothetical protein
MYRHIRLPSECCDIMIALVGVVSPTVVFQDIVDMLDYVDGSWI